MEARRIAWAFVLSAALTGCGKAPPAHPPPPTVRVVAAERSDTELVYEWLATLDGSTDAEIRPRVEGPIEAVSYQEGTVVKQDTLLFTIDPRPFAAALDKARGDHEAAIAQLGKSRADVARYTPLVAEHAISREQLDDAIAAVHQAQGNVQATKGLLETARLNLQWTHVQSPLDGIAGIARTRVGNLVNPSQVLTTISKVDPIRVSIRISEREYLNAAFILNHVNDPQYANRRIIELILIDGRIHPYRASRVIVGREIDPTTGTLLVQALFPNPGNILRPGMFGKARVYTGRMTSAVRVPEQAVQQLQGLTQVSIVDPQGRVQLRSIKLGRLVDHSYAVEEGLQAGDRVIVEGQQNAPPGASINAQPATDGGAPQRGDGGS